MNTPITAIEPSVRVLRRVVIEHVEPEIDSGRFPIKRTVGEQVRVRADIFADGHDLLGAALLYRRADETRWIEEQMRLVENDRWEGGFQVDTLGRYTYTVVAWVDHFRTWNAHLQKRAEAGQDISVDVLIGAKIVQASADRARGADSRELAGAAMKLQEFSSKDRAAALSAAQSSELGLLVNRNRDQSADTRYGRELVVVVDPERARFSAWYEMFPALLRHGSDTPRHLSRLHRSPRLRRGYGI